ncbi:hypothetical protein CHL76_05305 [Marinococcus halophilus]|nr:hypothetical protein CHL76_05305 [Marinococcus halophilus]
MARRFFYVFACLRVFLKCDPSLFLNGYWKLGIPSIVAPPHAAEYSKTAAGDLMNKEFSLLFSNLCYRSLAKFAASAKVNE